MLIGDDELLMIEAEAAGFEVNDYPISGVQLSAIIERLRQAERNVRIMEPYMLHALSLKRTRKMNERWMLPRLGALILSVCAAGVSIGMTGTLQAVVDMSNSPTPHDMSPLISLVAAGLLPLIAVFFPLFYIIDNTAERRLKEGKYDA